VRPDPWLHCHLGGHLLLWLVSLLGIIGRVLVVCSEQIAVNHLKYTPFTYDFLWLSPGLLSPG